VQFHGCLHLLLPACARCHAWRCRRHLHARTSAHASSVEIFLACS
jgi:hypothetical protein